jgi:type IV pilus assembly protein PilB
MQHVRPVPKIPEKKPISLRVGELLVKEGFIERHQLVQALDSQERGSQDAELPLGTLMVKKDLISEPDLERLLNHPDLRKNLGALLVEKNIITQKELETCLRLKKTNEPLGQVLIRRGLLTQHQLDTALEQQAGRVRIGELAYNLDMISEIDLDEVVRIKSGHRTIGEILCDLKMVTIEDLNYILRKYGKQLRLGDILLKQGLIDENQYQIAMQEQNQTRTKLGKVLVQRKYITPDQLYSALSRQFNIPYRAMGGYEFDSRQRRVLTGLIGEKYALKHSILPISLRDNRLQVGIADPANKQSSASLAPLYPDLKIEPVLISRQKYDELFQALYRSSGADRVNRAVDGIQDMELIELNMQEDQLEEEAARANDMMAEQVVDFIVRLGISKGASDIHIEQDRQGARLRYRTDGICKEVDIDWLNEKLQDMPNAVISRIKVLSNLDIAERRLPQDGVFRVNYYDPQQDRRFDLDFRVATCPAIVGENVTIRILDSRQANVGLENLNHSSHVLGPLKRLFKSAAGMILVTGPTGSGKSSTLYAALRYIYHPGIKIITAEDPIEYSFPGIMQTQIKPKIGLNFVRLLRSFLRLDPDVILVGEIRDTETASIAFDAAQTGHLLLSTLHTNDAVSAVSRLLDLDIEHNQVASSLIGVLAQRLVRKTCDVCKQPYNPPAEEWGLFFDTYPDHLTFSKGMGCKACGYSGYKGRTLISELFEINREIALALSRGISETELKRMAHESGMKTMIDDGLLKLDQTTLTEIIRVVPIEMIKAFASKIKRGKITAANPGEHGGKPYTERIHFVLASPEDEIETLESLYERYQDLRASVGQEPGPVTADLFIEFIQRTYREITRQHRCNRLSLEFTAEKNQVIMTAAPVEETP